MNYYYFKSLRGVSRICEKARIGKWIPRLAFDILSRGGGGLPCDVAKAESLLRSIQPDPHTSGLRKNVLEPPSVDLQIVVPAYNTGQFLDDCLQSILSQKTTYTYKVVVVNDGSTDNSAEILRRYENDERVIVITQENRGLSGARNRALERIFGRYVGFVDSDDMLAPGAIQLWLDTARKHDADVVDGSFLRRSVTGDLWGGYVHPTNNSCSGFICTRIFKSEIWSDVCFPEQYWFEDTLMAFLVFLKIQRYYSIPDYVYYYTQNPGSITQSMKGKPKSIDSFYVVRALARDAVAAGIMDKNSAYAVNNLLRHFQITWHRTWSLGKDVERAIFVLSCALYDELCPDAPLARPALRPLQRALREHNFAHYRRECCLM